MPTYLVDHATYRPPDEDLIHGAAVMRDPGAHAWGERHGIGYLSPQFRGPMAGLFARYGIGTGYVPQWLTPGDGGRNGPPQFGYDRRMHEMMRSMCGAVDLLLGKTGVAASDIDIVITTMNTFHSVPSASAMLVNHYKMREDIESYSLVGQGCSMGAVCVHLIDDLLKAHPNCNALLVTTEILSAGLYRGDNPAHMLGNLLFREGGAAVLLSNRRSQVPAAKYQLLHSVRVHTGASDRACASMATTDDGAGNVSAVFNADTPWAAKNVIERAVKKIAPRILSWGQLTAAALNLAQRRWYGAEAVPRYAPCFADCIDHFALHPGNHGMLMGFVKGLRLPAAKALPSFAALRDYGNTSASSTWYVMAYLEGVGGGVRRGETVLQLGVGSGCKAGVNVWRALRDVRDDQPAWQHLRGVPVTEADLPLPISKPPAADTAAAAAGGGKEGEQQMAEADADSAAFLRSTAAAAAAGGGASEAAGHPGRRQQRRSATAAQ